METTGDADTPRGQLLSIIVPTYNEASTIGRICDRIARVKLVGGVRKEIVIVNDCSSDDTEMVVAEYMRNNAGVAVRYINHEANRGKGAALRTGIAEAAGDFIVIQDADLEYDPHEYNLLLQPILDGHADVVYGSRFMSGAPHRLLLFGWRVGNSILTFVSNLFTRLELTDMETCYKLFRADIIKSLELKEDGFGFEPEVTAKIARRADIRVHEVPVSYRPRTYREGKKITWKDGVKSLYCIVKYGLARVR